jgi:hypothetical protein
MFLVDLRDRSTTIRRVESRPPGGMASFGWSPDGDELVLLLVGQSTRVSVSSAADGVARRRTDDRQGDPTGRCLEPGGQDFWDISYARDLIRTR